ncbi:MAG: neutral/alkaline non-lysosomal ceramidase N-terminal domain-containing protein [Bacteroidales bacterium]|nr:neutral/alkaline non-lysosomal ceramidase N-terminal domain-containing protein [Bacteroidales bacterium]
MRRFFLTLALAAMSVLSFAQPRQTGPSDWGNFKRYEPANAALTADPLVVLMGDSITDFWYDEDPDFFTKNNFAGRGISGQTASQMLVRFKQDVIDLHPKAVAIMAGTNDLCQNLLGQAYYPDQTIFDNITAMCELAEKAGIKVLLCSITPCAHYMAIPEVDAGSLIVKMNQRLKAYADSQKNVTYVDYHTPIADAELGLPATGTYDGIHPAVNLYDDMERILTASLRKVLKVKTGFYTLPADEAEVRKLASDAKRRESGMPMTFEEMVEMVKRMFQSGGVRAAAPAPVQSNPRGQLYAGAAKVDITPDEKDLPPTSQGILDHCYARVIAFGNGATKAAFVTFDAGNADARVAQYIDEHAAAELGIPVGNIIYNGTHTHSGSSVRGDELTERVWGAVKQAVANMVPAKVGYGNGECHLNVKRDLFDPERGTWWEGPDYDGKSDKTVAVIYFESLAGKPIATYFNYAMHAVITGNTDKVSADFPGEAETYIESRYGPDFVASFASGAAGDQNPLYFQQTFDLRDIRIADYAARGEDISNRMPPGGQGLDRTKPEVQRLLGEQERMIRSYGQILGEEVKYVIMMMRRFETDVTLNCARKIVTVPGRRQTNGGGRAGYAGEYEDGPDVEVGLSLIMLDDIPVCGVASEVYNPIAVELKQKSPYARTMMTTVAYGFGARGGGYMPDDESYGAQVFEVLGSRFKQGYAQSAVVNGLLDMIHDATH